MLSRSSLLYALAMLGLAAAAFFITRVSIIDQAPKTVMATIEARIVQGAGDWNACNHNTVYGPRKNAARRANPDSIITSMAYDLSNGPVQVSGEIWPRYWSLSLYQQNSDNFFVVNDRHFNGPPLNGPEFNFIITQEGQSADTGTTLKLISPTEKGIMLIRRFAAFETDMPAILENQAAMYCGPTVAE